VATGHDRRVSGSVAVSCLAALLLWIPAIAATLSSTLRIGNGNEPESLDPQRATGVSAGNVLRDLYEGLTGISPTGELIPAAAESWRLREDGLEITFRLRAGLRWSNGDALTARDFAAGLRRVVDPATASGYARMFGVIAGATAIAEGRQPASMLGVEAPDDQTLVIRLDRPAPQLLALLAHPAASPVHRLDLAAATKPGGRIGNGAYRLQRWVVQSQLELVRNPAYWNDARTAIDRVVYLPTEDLNSELKRYRADELDVTTSVPATQAAWIRANLGAELHVATYLGSYFYGLNVTRAPFKGQPGLRRALSMAIDREVIVSKVLNGLAAPAWSLVPPGTRDYTPQVPAWAAWPRQRQLIEARRLYAAAGYTEARPLEVELRYNTSDDHKRIAVVVAAMWKQALGVRVRLVNEEWKVFLQNRKLRRVTQAFRNTWIADANDAMDFAALLTRDHPRNDSGYDNPAYEQWLAAATSVAQPLARRSALEAAERAMLDDAPIVPIYFYASKHLVKPRVRGWHDNILDWHYSKDLRLNCAASAPC